MLYETPSEVACHTLVYDHKGVGIKCKLIVQLTNILFNFPSYFSENTDANSEVLILNGCLKSKLYMSQKGKRLKFILYSFDEEYHKCNVISSSKTQHVYVASNYEPQEGPRLITLTICTR